MSDPFEDEVPLVIEIYQQKKPKKPKYREKLIWIVYILITNS